MLLKKDVCDCVHLTCYGITRACLEFLHEAWCSYQSIYSENENKEKDKNSHSFWNVQLPVCVDLRWVRLVHLSCSGCQTLFSFLKLTQFVQNDVTSHRLSAGRTTGGGRQRRGEFVHSQYLCLCKWSLQRETVSKQNWDVILYTTCKYTHAHRFEYQCDLVCVCWSYTKTNIDKTETHTDSSHTVAVLHLRNGKTIVRFSVPLCVFFFTSFVSNTTKKLQQSQQQYQSYQ